MELILRMELIPSELKIINRRKWKKTTIKEKAVVSKNWNVGRNRMNLSRLYIKKRGISQKMSVLD